jgi:hypothetical protein
MNKDFAMKHSLELIGKIHLVFVEIIHRRPLVLKNIMEETETLEVLLGGQVSHVVFVII